MEANGRQIISQSHAARLRGCSRQRISELVSKGRFTTPTDDKGHSIAGTVYLDEVVRFEEGTAGRPRKSQADWFVVGASVLWKLKPRNGYGYTLPIIGTVVKSSNKRIQLHFIGGDDAEHYAWANREDCVLLDRVVDAEQLEEPKVASAYSDEIIELGNGRYVHAGDPEQKIMTRKSEF